MSSVNVLPTAPTERLYPVFPMPVADNFRL